MAMIIKEMKIGETKDHIRMMKRWGVIMRVMKIGETKDKIRMMKSCWRDDKEKDEKIGVMRMM